MNITETAKLYVAQIVPEIDAHAARAPSAALALAALTGPAMATPILHQPPVPVPVGLLLTIDPFEGRHSFSPADGINAYAGGKTGHLTASPHEPRTVRWSRAGAWTATETRHPHYAGRIWGPPGYPVGFIGDCDCTTPEPPPAPAPVPLPAAGWLMLVGLGALLIKGKSYTT